MKPLLLITYATKRGSTRQVAETIAATLKADGLDADVLPAADVDDLTAYAGVVLGSALYMGRPHVDARRFLRRHHSALASMPVAIFAMGPATMSADDVESSRKQLDRALAKVSDLTPVSIAIFGGVVDPGALHFPFNRMELTDAREWSSIERWAREAGALLSARLPAAV